MAKKTGENLSESDNNYRFLSNATAEIKMMKAVVRPIKVKSEGDVGWKELDEELRLLNTSIGLEGLQSNRIRFAENSFVLMSGAVNLINFLFQRKKSGQEIETLVFLDKTARNAAYIFYTIWDNLAELYQLKGKKDILGKKPKIRFINVGLGENDKHHDLEANKRLGEVYNKQDFLGRVLIVDEVIYSSGSVRRASSSLSSAGYKPTSMEMLENFTSLPQWYGSDELKGVVDVGLISKEVRDLAARIDDHDFKMVESAIRMVGREEFIYICENRSSLKSIVSQVGMRRNGSLDFAVNLVRRLNLSGSALNQFVRYVASAGGFLALSPDDNTKAATREYRAALKLMITESIRRGLVRLN